MKETLIKHCKHHGQVPHVEAVDGRFRCKPCRVDAVQRRRAKIKKLAVEYLGGCCVVCGYSRYLGALEFHHRNPNEKDFEINSSLGWDKISVELDKCDLLCANCHREVHNDLRSIKD